MEDTTANSAVDISMHCGRVRVEKEVDDGEGLAMRFFVQVMTSWGALSSACVNRELGSSSEFLEQTY